MRITDNNGSGAIDMFFAIAPFPRRGRQAGVLVEYFAKITHIIKSTFHRHSVSDSESLINSFSAALTR
jgi:hypothetical protein